MLLSKFGPKMLLRMISVLPKDKVMKHIALLVLIIVAQVSFAEDGNDTLKRLIVERTNAIAELKSIVNDSEQKNDTRIGALLELYKYRDSGAELLACEYVSLKRDGWTSHQTVSEGLDSAYPASSILKLAGEKAYKLLSSEFGKVKDGEVKKVIESIFIYRASQSTDSSRARTVAIESLLKHGNLNDTAKKMLRDALADLK